MAKIINLAKARKARKRDAKRALADANAVKFGRSTAEKRRDVHDAQRAETRLDGHRRDPPPRDEA